MDATTLGGVIIAAYEKTLSGRAAQQFAYKGQVSRWQIATYWWQNLPEAETTRLLKA